MTDQRRHKRPKSYYVKSASKKFKNDGYELDAGMKGFLITCNRNEYECKKDAYQLLNEYADILYGPMEDDHKLDESEEEDFDLALKKEVSDLKEKKKWRFKAVKSGANNVLFITTEIENPCDLAHYILTDLQQTKKLKSRTILRLLPISGTCKTHEDKIEKLAEEIVGPHFEFTCTTYMYIVKIRSNNSVKRTRIMGILDTVIRRHEDLNHHVNMDNPDLVILVEVIRNICCMSVIKDFKKFRKYNLHSVVEDANDESKEKDGKKENDGNDDSKGKAEIETQGSRPNCSQEEERSPAVENTPTEMETSTALSEPEIDDVQETEEHSNTKVALNVVGSDLKEPEADRAEVSGIDDCVNDDCKQPENDDIVDKHSK